MIRNILATCLLMSIAIPAIALAEPGDMMHMTINVKAQVAASAIPPQTVNVNVCTSKSHDMRDIVRSSKRQKNCAISDYKVTGSTATFHETCSAGPIQMSGDASFTLQLDAVHGTLHTDSDMNGQKMTVDTTYDGTVTGNCDYTPPKPAP